MIRKILIAACLVTIINLSSSTPANLVGEYHSKIAPAWRWIFGRCLTNGYTYMKDFDEEKFFNGTWNELLGSGQQTLYQIGNKCPTIAATHSSDGKKANLLFYGYQALLKKWITQFAQADLTMLESSKFNVTFEILGGLVDLTIPMSVLSTDYDNYAVTYSCKEAGPMKLELASVLTRTRGDNSTLEAVKEAVELAGLDFEEFRPVDLNKCGPNEPHL